MRLTPKSIRGPRASNRTWELFAEERLRRIRQYEAAYEWIPRFGDFHRKPGESGYAFDERLCRKVAFIWAPELERAGVAQGGDGPFHAYLIAWDVLRSPSEEGAVRVTLIRRKGP